MDKKSFWQSGHKPTLLGSFLYFDISFMIWGMIGPLSVIIALDYPMDPVQKAQLVALPVLGGSILRLVLGFLSDYIGPKLTAQIGMILTLIPLLLGWQWVQSLEQLYVVAILLGIAGASFAAALPLAGQWYPKEHQGLAMGIAGAGNSGTVIATLFANRLAQHFGSWEIVFGIAMIPIILVFIFFTIFAKNSPNRPEPKKLSQYATVLKQRDAWVFCAFYCVTFGGFVGLANYLTIFFNTQYGLTAVQAADIATICVIAGSFFRPVGGFLADRIGGTKMLMYLYSGAGIMLACVSFLPPLPVVVSLLFVGMMCLGAGNGSVFQLVPQRFGNEIGLMTGIVGAAGGLGGYALPLILGNLYKATGSYTIGFIMLSIIVLCCLSLLVVMQMKWRTSWLSHSVTKTARQAS
ncbi:NarK/NasA family nitrate transporter [Paenibacillus sp. PsM32]|uniref:nitrate/nitrite transporter n=1 Tax=unclassified Paenibacillus TaxID=185978 RepID=UPI002365E4EF|nr:MULTISPECIES: nitrate/nitrite transporter [unclassified Paenibacillus]MDN4617244.1 NarK/NasA family nitrate transporter [Paenibacillus sp. PsM32]WDF53267.1 NarK/NasA family nitrate transporter [Paenibacillus sp. KACC 21273]